MAQVKPVGGLIVTDPVVTVAQFTLSDQVMVTGLSTTTPVAPFEGKIESSVSAKAVFTGRMRKARRRDIMVIMANKCPMMARPGLILIFNIVAPVKLQCVIP